MSEFKVGEVAVACHLITAPERNESECVVIVGLRVLARARCRKLGFIAENVPLYKVRYADGHEINIRPQNLRKRHPPSFDEAAARQAMLHCIQRAKRGSGVEV